MLTDRFLQLYTDRLTYFSSPFKNWPLLVVPIEQIRTVRILDNRNGSLFEIVLHCHLNSLLIDSQYMRNH